MTVRGRRWWPALPVALLLAGCSTTVSGDPTAQAMPTPAATTSSVPATTTTAPPVTTTTKAKPATTTRKPEQRPKVNPHTTVTDVPAPTAKPPAQQKMVTYLITGSGTVSVRYLSGGSMHSASNIGLPWRKTVPLSNGQYAMDITTGSNANVDEQVSVEGAVVGTGHNEGAGSGSFSGSY